MAEHYFSPAPAGRSSPRTMEVRVRGRALAFAVDRGVFSTGRLDPGTALLIETLPLRPGASVLDLGCGWGAIGLTAKLEVGEGRVVMVDVNARALSLAAATAEAWDVEVDIRQGDGLAPVGAGERFDLIATNPPIRAGKALYHAWAEEARGHLGPGGRLFAVLRVRQGARSFERHLRSLYPDVRVEDRQGGYRVLSAGFAGAPRVL